jgi:hypothetical protein
LQVSETHPIQNQGAHINRNRWGHIISGKKQ